MTAENTSTDAPTSREDQFFGKKTTIDEMVEEAEATEKEAKTVEPITVEEVAEGEPSGLVTEPTATPEKPALKTKESKTGDEELDTYSEKVQKRIDKLTWEREDAKRKATEADAVRQEAVRYAQAVNQQNQQQANIIAHGEARLVDQIKTRAALAVDAASQEYAQAYEAGDTAKIIEAQKKLTLAQAEQIESINYERDYQARQQQWQNQQQRNQQIAGQVPQQQQQVQPQQPQPTPESQTWAAKNKWFGDEKHRDMTAIAYAEHERIIKEEGVKADSPEYYEKIDAKVRHHFPEFFKEETKTQEPNTVVASGERNNSGKPRTVRLTPHQVSLAKTLGISNEQYARQALKEGS